jgi:hypothetical protein
MPAPQKVRTWDGSGRPKTPSSKRRIAYQLPWYGFRPILRNRHHRTIVASNPQEFLKKLV